MVVAIGLSCWVREAKEAVGCKITHAVTPALTSRSALIISIFTRSVFFAPSRRIFYFNFKFNFKCVSKEKIKTEIDISIFSLLTHLKFKLKLK